MRVRKTENQDQILEFLKEGAKTFEEILNMRLQGVKSNRKGSDHIRLNLSQLLSEMAMHDKIVVMRDADQKKHYKLP